MEQRDRIIDAYQHYLREEGKPPPSIFRFCQSLEMGERDFFQCFGSFDAVESAFWERLVDRVIQAVTSGSEWREFSARQRLLTFLFAFNEESLHYRSLLLERVKPLGFRGEADFLRGLRRRYHEFVEKEVVEYGLQTGEIADRPRLKSLYAKSLYRLFRGVLDFHLRDDSPGFERTDAAVEKSVHFAFELMRKQAFDAAFDLLKFLKQDSDRACCCC